MARIFSRASKYVQDLAAKVIEKHHPEIAKADLTINYFFANASRGHALTLGGYPCQAVVKIIGYKERVAGRGDAEIVIDEEKWEHLTEPEQFALLDHELYHLIVVKDKHGLTKYDLLDRPKLRMRRHDVDFGWFRAVAERNGEHSAEQKQARFLFDSDGQAFFPFLLTSTTAEAEGKVVSLQSRQPSRARAAAGS